MTIGAPIAALYAGLHALLLVVLSLLVSLVRRKQRISVGDGDDPALIRAMRVQGNFVEYVPLALLLLLVLELNGVSSPWLHAAGSSLFASRLLHAWGLSHSNGRSFGRAAGMAGTWSVLLALGLAGIWVMLRT